MIQFSIFIEISSLDVSQRFDLSGCLKVIIRKPIKALNALISISFKTVSKLVPLKKGVVS